METSPKLVLEVDGDVTGLTYTFVWTLEMGLTDRSVHRSIPYLITAVKELFCSWDMTTRGVIFRLSACSIDYPGEVSSSCLLAP